MGSITYKELRHWRYQIAEPCLIPYESLEMKLMMFNQKPVMHPFFTIGNLGVRVEALYCWDGATGVIRQTQDLVIASLIHDIGCQAVNLGILPPDFRAAFDSEYKKQAIKHGASPIRIALHHTAISLWGMIPKSGSIAPYAKTKTLVVD